MKKFSLFIILFFTAGLCFAQPGEWVWLHGVNTINNPGVFGVQGVSAPANNPPGFYESCEWTDPSGNLWLYGGLFSNGQEYGDLWKYNPGINEWVWMKGTGIASSTPNYGTLGIPSPANDPGSRAWGMSSWVDDQGNLWMLGGSNVGGDYADLWRFEPATNNWTWMKGPQGFGALGVYGTQGVPAPANFPGGRHECAGTWTDGAGNLWLLGGYDGNSFQNDLWCYNIVLNEWTWMKGSQVGGAPDVYGLQGIEDPSNTPGNRATYSHWKDLNGNFWLFGGTNFINHDYNDLWRFNPSTNNWAWFKGNTSNGHYGTQCIPDLANTPGTRFETRSTASDANGNFWLFGGLEGVSILPYNDLWMYCVSINSWTWISGDNFTNPAGNWGTMGLSSPLNKPDGRMGALMWSDQNGHLYMFGGSTSGWPDSYNDLWKFTIDPSCAPCASTPQALFTAPNQICPGTCTNFTNASLNSTFYLWDFPGGNPSVSTDVNPTNICYNTPGNYDVTLIASNGGNSDTTTLLNFITVFPSPPPQGILQSSDTLFANPGAVSYQWYSNGNLIPGATDYFYVAPESGNYNVVATDTNGCEVEAVIFDVVAGISQWAVGNWQLAIFPNPVSDKLTVIHYSSHGGQALSETVNNISVHNSLGEKITVDVTMVSSAQEEKFEIDVTSLSPGIYFVEVESGNGLSRKMFTKQ